MEVYSKRRAGVFASGGRMPSIEFTRVPPLGEGSATKVDLIEGRVGGARGEEKIVLYLRSALWWFSPGPGRRLLYRHGVGLGLARQHAPRIGLRSAARSNPGTVPA